MHMIGHSIDLQNLVIMFLDDSGDVFIKFVFPVSLNKRNSILDRKNSLNMNLGVGVCHI